MKKLETTITEIGREGPLKPTSPLFSIVNDSYFPVWIDNYKLPPGRSFSIDASPIVAEFAKLGVEVTNETTYNLKFDPTSPHLRHAVQLVQLEIKE